jgi:hypothetical protein
MTTLYWTLYIFYALVQAVILARYGFEIEEKDSPVFAVVMMAIFAPIMTAVSVCCGFYYAVNWLVTYHPGPKKPTAEEAAIERLAKHQKAVQKEVDTVLNK